MVQSIFFEENNSIPPSIEKIEAIAEGVIAELPEELKKHVGGLKIVVEDFPDTYVIQEMLKMGMYETFGMDIDASEMEEMPEEMSEMDTEISEMMDLKKSLLGHYESSGSVAVGSHLAMSPKQDIFYLYSDPILHAWVDAKKDPIDTFIKDIIVHKIGEHLGLSANDIAMFKEESSSNDGVRMYGENNVLGATVPSI